MPFVEDVFALIAQRWTPAAFGGALATAWEAHFIDTVSARLAAGRPLSSQQCRIVLTMISKAGAALVHDGVLTQADLGAVLRDPQYRRPPYRSTGQSVRSEIRHLGGYYFGIRLPYNETAVHDIRALYVPGDMEKPWFHHASRIWVVALMRWNHAALRRLIETHRLQMDAATRDYLTLAKYSQSKPATVVYHAGSGRFITNICDNPLLTRWAVHVAGGERI